MLQRRVCRWLPSMQHGDSMTSRTRKRQDSMHEINTHPPACSWWVLSGMPDCYTAMVSHVMHASTVAIKQVVHPQHPGLHRMTRCLMTAVSPSSCLMWLLLSLPWLWWCWWWCSWMWGWVGKRERARHSKYWNSRGGWLYGNWKDIYFMIVEYSTLLILTTIDMLHSNALGQLSARDTLMLMNEPSRFTMTITDTYHSKQRRTADSLYRCWRISLTD